MHEQIIAAEFDNFFEFPTDDRSQVSSMSAKLFADHISEITSARLRALIEDIKAWDVDQYMTIPHELRARMQAELVPNA